MSLMITYFIINITVLGKTKDLIFILYGTKYLISIHTKTLRKILGIRQNQ
jgi:hypothetical protein